MIGQQVGDLVATSIARLQAAAPADLEAVRAHGEALIAYSDSMRQRNLELKRFLRTTLYRHYRVHRMSIKARRVIESLFEAFFSDPRLLPDKAQQQVRLLDAVQGEAGRARAVADYIAGMTDRYAIAEYERVYNPKELT
jgi:dGTPase